MALVVAATVAGLVATAAGELPWRMLPLHEWSTDRPARFVEAEAYPVDCATRAVPCSGDLDLTTAEHAPFCGEVTGGDVYVSGVLRFPPYCLRRVVGGGVRVEGNADVTSMHGFGRLESVEGSVVLVNNRNLVSLRGLDALEVVGGDLLVERCGFPVALTAVDALVAREQAERLEDEAFHFSRVLSQEPHVLGTTLFEEDVLAELQTLRGLDRLERVGGAMRIVDNPRLVSLVGLGQLEAVAGDLVLHGNLRLVSLLGLSALSEIAGDLVVESNPQLLSLAGTQALATVEGNLVVAGNEVLEELGGGLAALESVGGNVTVWRNPALQAPSRAAPIGPQFVGGFFNVEDNAKLQTLQGFARLQTIGGTLFVLRNPAMASLSPGFGALNTVGGDLYVQGEFPSLVGLDALATVAGSVVVHALPQLTSLAGLGGLRSVGGDLIVHLNPQLASLNALGALREVRGRVQIRDNAQLATINTFLDALGYVGDYLLLDYTAGDVACPRGTGVRSGERALIYDTTAPPPEAPADVEHGNWCTLHCKPPYQVSAPRRMWQARQADLWGPAWAPACAVAS